MVEPPSDRRKNDRTLAEISALIVNTNDSKDKAILMVLMRMCESLEANTEATGRIEKLATEQGDKFIEHVEKFNDHEGNEKVIIGQAKTAWWVMTGMFVVVATLGMALTKVYLDKLDATQAEVVLIKTELEKIKADVGLIRERHRIEDEIAKQRK